MACKGNSEPLPADGGAQDASPQVAGAATASATAASPPPLQMPKADPTKKKMGVRGFKIPFFGGGRKAAPPDPVPPEGAFRRRTSSVGPDEDVSVQKKKSGNLGKYRRDIDPEPRSTPNF